MCGIAGVVAWDDRYRVDRETLQRMSARIAHRGPDGDGLYLNHEQEARPGRPQVGLVHRRLAIIDLDPRANQPFTDRHGRWIVFNGEIYNYRELRAELTTLQPDYEWRTTSDTEVLLVAYDAWGETCVEKLNGMFAFAVWDEPKQALFLARDRMGQKPLYVAACYGTLGAKSKPVVVSKQNPNLAFAFSSEISPLLALPWVDQTICPLHLAQYVAFGYPIGGTMYRGVDGLARATTLSAGSSHLLNPGYFDPGAAAGLNKQLPDAEACRDTRALVRQAVSRQLVSDVPLGCFLSGGVDSSVIAASMCAAMPNDERPLTFSVQFDDPRYDESSYATAVAKHLDTRHHTFPVRIDAAQDLPKIAAAFGEPFGDSSSLPTYYLARAIRDHVKVALSGDGGDELFGGYDRYRAMQWARRLRALGVGTAAAMAGPLLPGSHPKSRSARLRRFAASLALNDEQRYRSFLLLDGKEPTDLLQQHVAEATGQPTFFGATAWPAMQFRFELKNTNDVVRAALSADRAIYLPLDLLRKVDICSMRHALEVRSPFMDHELVQFAAGLTTDQLLNGGPKRMLREAFADDLPAWVFKRKKMGFAVPIGDWCRAELRPMLHDHLFAADSFAAGHFNTPVVRRLVEEHETKRQDHSQRLYALLMLELWWKQQKP